MLLLSSEWLSHWMSPLKNVSCCIWITPGNQRSLKEVFKYIPKTARTRGIAQLLTCIFSKPHHNYDDTIHPWRLINHSAQILRDAFNPPSIFWAVQLDSHYSASSQRRSLTVTFLCCQLKWWPGSLDSYGWMRCERRACHIKVITRPAGLHVPVWQLGVVSIATNSKQWPWLGFCQNRTSIVALWLDTFILCLTSSIFCSSLAHLFRDHLWVEL